MGKIISFSYPIVSMPKSKNLCGVGKRISKFFILLSSKFIVKGAPESPGFFQ